MRKINRFLNLLNIFIDSNFQELAFKLSLTSRTLNRRYRESGIEKIWYDRTEISHDSLVKHVENRDIISIKRFLDKREKSIYRNLYINACLSGWYELYSIVLPEISTVFLNSSYKYKYYVGGWDLHSLQKFMEKYILDVDVLDVLDVLPDISKKNTSIIHNALKYAIISNKKENVEYLEKIIWKHNMNILPQFYMDGFMWAINYNRPELIDYLYHDGFLIENGDFTEYHDILIAIYNSSLTRTETINVIERIDYVINEYNKEYTEYTDKVIDIPLLYTYILSSATNKINIYFLEYVVSKGYLNILESRSIVYNILNLIYRSYLSRSDNIKILEMMDKAMNENDKECIEIPQLYRSIISSSDTINRIFIEYSHAKGYGDYSDLLGLN